MKKILYSILFIASAMFASCDDYLELSSEDSFVDGNYWTSAATVGAFVDGLHIDLRSKESTLYLAGEQRGGLLSGVSTFGVTINYANLINHTITVDSPVFGWSGFYSSILQVNILIDKLEKGLSFLSEAEKNYYLGQAYGLRSYYYFYLLRMFGGVPIVDAPKVTQGATSADQLYTARSTEAETLEFIKKDVERSETAFSSDNFTLASKRNLWNKAATLMLKAEVYLWAAKVYGGTTKTSDLNTAKTALTAIKNSNKFDLMDNFADVFDYNNKGNKEIIFSMYHLRDEAELYMKLFTYDIPTMANYYDRNGNAMNDPLNVGDKTSTNFEWKWSFYETFDAADTRRDATFLDFYSQDGSKKGVVLRKFLGTVDASTKIRYYCDDMPVYRYADLLLMMAEIKNALQEDPSDEINAIRERAYGEGNYTVYTNQDFAANELAILAERDKEFVREGKRWFDVRRMQDANGKPLAFTLSGLSESESYKLKYPLTNSTLLGDPALEQTPEWVGK